MAVKLRMTRIGRRHRPFFRINAIESRNPRDGRVIEKLGHYDPIEKDKSKQVVLDKERVKYWLDKGAVPSDTVAQILRREGIKTRYGEEKSARRARAKAVARAKGRLFTSDERAAAEKAAAKAEEEAKKQAEEKAKAEKEAEAKAKTEEKAEPKPDAKAEKAEETEKKTEEKAEAKAPAEPKEETKDEAKSEPEAKAKAEDKKEPKKKKKSGEEDKQQ
jgi:small subunit ribosomal protein S16